MTDNALYLLSHQVGEALKRRQRKITFAESCTGGLLAASITDIAGSSAYFEYGFVTYSNQAKQRMLGVKALTLSQWGAVSEATVREMALGALLAAKADISVSISGIAGPDGGSAAKPVGTVWFGWADSGGKVKTQRKYFYGDRIAIRQQAAFYALSIVAKEFI